MLLSLFSSLRFRIGAGVILALLLALGIQTWRANHYKRALALLASEYTLAQAQAETAHRAALAAQEAAYRRKAEHADTEHEKALTGAYSAADRYIASHRVRTGNQSSACTTAAPASGGGSGVSQEPPADAVVVAAGDVTACTGAAEYAWSAFQWARGLNEGKGD